MNSLDARYVWRISYLDILSLPNSPPPTMIRPTALIPRDTNSPQARGLRNQHTIPTKARLTYFAEKSLSLELQYKSESTWTPCFDIPSVKIPSVAYLGFSAETGELSDNHDIISVQTKNLYSPGGSTDKSKPLSGSGGAGTARFPTKGVKGERQGGGWGWFFLKFVVFGLVLTGAYVGFTVYRSNKRRDRF